MSVNTSTTTSGIVPDPDNYDFDPYAVWGMADLLAKINDADSIADWSEILFKSSELEERPARCAGRGQVLNCCDGLD